MKLFEKLRVSKFWAGVWPDVNTNSSLAGKTSGKPNGRAIDADCTIDKEVLTLRCGIKICYLSSRFFNKSGSIRFVMGRFMTIAKLNFCHSNIMIWKNCNFKMSSQL